jgi:hypothetical protein
MLHYPYYVHILENTVKPSNSTPKVTEMKTNQEASDFNQGNVRGVTQNFREFARNNINPLAPKFSFKF